MAIRSIGSGAISFGLVLIPVNLYVAASSESPSFNLLHAKCGSRIKQQAAVATATAGPRIRRTDDELRLERDFQVIADRVLAPGETDDPEEVERRTDKALAVVAGLKGLRSGKKTLHGT